MYYIWDTCRGNGAFHSPCLAAVVLYYILYMYYVLYILYIIYMIHILCIIFGTNALVMIPCTVSAWQQLCYTQ